MTTVRFGITSDLFLTAHSALVNLTKEKEKLEERLGSVEGEILLATEDLLTALGESLIESD